MFHKHKMFTDFYTFLRNETTICTKLKYFQQSAKTTPLNVTIPIFISEHSLIMIQSPLTL